jgi:penicillin-binding protein 2
MAEDNRRIVIRLGVLQVGVTVIFSILALSFWFFQVVQHEKFKEMAENNHQRTLPLRAPRGVLFDRNGRVLVENKSSVNISIVREHTIDLGRTVRLLAAVTGVEEQYIKDVVEKHRREPSYRPIVVIEAASEAQIASVAARKLELPDVVTEEVPARQYPTDALAAHLFGYVGEINDAQVAKENLPSGSIVGQSGIEKVYNRLLMGDDGAKLVVVNSVGREINVLENTPPTEGKRIQLTIDYDLQRAAEEGFRSLGYNGAAVVMDPRNGEVLSYVSLPAFDPNDFATGGIKPATWNALNTDKLKPLQNRAIQGRYSPGSTFKIVVATAALEEGIVTPDFRVSCGGGATFWGRYFQCHLKGGHGSVDMRHAIEKSCNVYFYTLGNMVGIDKLHKWATALGLGVKTGIDLPNEIEGIMPSTAWKQEKYNEKWYPGETISVSIGQGQVSVTPISLATMISTVANGGTRYVPHLVKAVNDGSGWQPQPPPPPAANVQFKKETFAALHDGLWMVVNAAGTGGRGKILGRDVAGKTGTAQVISLQGAKVAQGKMDVRDHGWFVFFAPRDNPEIAGVIFAEHAEHGYLGAPIAKYVMETYFAKKEGKPFPPPPKPGPPAAAVVATTATPAPHRSPGTP